MADEAVFDSWAVRIGGYVRTAPYASSKMQMLSSSGARLIQFPLFPIPKRPTATVEFGVPVKPWRKLLAWDGKTLKLTENHLPNSESINEIEIEPLKAQRLLNFDPFGGPKFTTNAGSRISMKLPIDVKHKQFVLDVTDKGGTEHRFWLGGFFDGGSVSWLINLQPSEIRRIELKDRLMAEDYFWKTFPDVALKPSEAPALQEKFEFDRKHMPRSARAFGPMHDEVVQADETKTNCFLDLDSGSLLTPSAPVVEAIENNGATPERTWETRDIHGEGSRAYRYVQWIRETGADLLYMGNGRIVAFDCLLTPAHGESSTNWEDINSVRPEQWQRTIASLQWAQAVREAKRNNTPVPKPPKEAGLGDSAVQLESETPSGPRVNELTLDQSRLWHFKTKRGAEGILGIVGFTNNPASVHIRYKLLESGKRSDSNHDLKKVTFLQPQLQVSSNGCSVLTVVTDTPMAPEEHLFSVLDFAPNGAMRHVKFSEQTNSTPAGPKTVHSLTWTFGGNLDAGFGQREANLALQQLQENGSRSYTMVAGGQIPMFTVTNGSGQVLIGYVNYHHHFGEAVPTTEKVAPVMALNPLTR